MTEDMYFYEPSQGHGLPHDPFYGIIGPRPLGWISSCDENGCLNLAPYSFFNAFSQKPPIIGFASTGRKDSLNNIEKNGEFGWNLATLPLAEAMNATCATVPPDVDEFTLSGLTPAASRLVNVPRVLESPVSFECRLTQIIHLKDAAQVHVPVWLVLGEVVAVHIAHWLLRDGIYDTAAAQPILRAGGKADYFTVRDSDKFSMRRPGV